MAELADAPDFGCVTTVELLGVIMSVRILHLIYLRTGEMLLSKKQYFHWKEIQDEYEHYMTDLAFDSCEDLISFFELDFGDECHWPFSKDEIFHFMNSAKVVLST